MVFSAHETDEISKGVNVDRQDRSLKSELWALHYSEAGKEEQTSKGD